LRQSHQKLPSIEAACGDSVRPTCGRGAGDAVGEGARSQSVSPPANARPPATNSAVETSPEARASLRIAAPVGVQWFPEHPVRFDPSRLALARPPKNAPTASAPAPAPVARMPARASGPRPAAFGTSGAALSGLASSGTASDVIRPSAASWIVVVHAF